MTAPPSISEWDFSFNALRESMELEQKYSTGDDLAGYLLQDFPSFSELPFDPSSPEEDSDSEIETQTVSVSTAFTPTSFSDTFPPDIVLLSSDLVAFYAKKQILSRVCLNQTNGFLSPTRTSDDTPVILPERASVLNVMLHTIYDIPCTQYQPSIEDLIEAVNSLRLYGANLEYHLSPQAPLFAHLLSYAPLCPLELYTLAASHSLEELAKASSVHLMSYPLYNVSDEAALAIGTSYLIRLFSLHTNRKEELKRLLLRPPTPHAETAECDFMMQKQLTRAWALATNHLAWDAKPDTSAGAIEAVLRPLQEVVTCEVCKSALRERSKELIVQWTMTKEHLSTSLTTKWLLISGDTLAEWGMLLSYKKTSWIDVIHL